MGHLALQRLLPLLELLLGLTQPLATPFQLVQLEGTDLIGIEQALVLSRERRSLALQALEFALGVSYVGAIAPLLLPQIAHQHLRLLQ